MDDRVPEGDGLPPSVRFLKWLVIVLTLTMIVGVITVVAVIVTRIPQVMGDAEPQMGQLPPAITLPEGVTPGAATFGQGWIAVVVVEGDDGAERIMIFGNDGRLRQEIPIEAP